MNLASGYQRDRYSEKDLRCTHYDRCSEHAERQNYGYWLYTSYAWPTEEERAGVDEAA